MLCLSCGLSYSRHAVECSVIPKPMPLTTTFYCFLFPCWSVSTLEFKSGRNYNLFCSSLYTSSLTLYLVHRNDQIIVQWVNEDLKPAVFSWSWNVSIIYTIYNCGLITLHVFPSISSPVWTNHLLLCSTGHSHLGAARALLGNWFLPYRDHSACRQGGRLE